MSAKGYVKELVRCVNKLLKQERKQLKKLSTPFPSRYKPEIDITDKLDTMFTTRFQHFIGVLRWLVKIGRVDIFYESLYSHSTWFYLTRVTFKWFTTFLDTLITIRTHNWCSTMPTR